MKISMTSVIGVLGLVGVLASCTSPNLGLTPKISGSVSGYSGGEKIIKVIVTRDSSLVTTGILKADGSFSIDLPVLSAASLGTLNAPICTSGTSSVTPSTAKTTYVAAGVFNDPNALSTSEFLTQSEFDLAAAVVGKKYTSVARIYADVDVVLTATDCVRANGTISGTWNLKAGWNEINIVEEVTAINPTQIRSIFSMGTAGKPWRIAPNSSISLFNLPFIRQ